MKIKKLKIEGFRSLRSVCWEPGCLNVVIGANGAGKSNLLRFLELVSVSAQGKLGKYVQGLGGMDPLVWDGAVSSIRGSLTLEESDCCPEKYEFELARLGLGSSYRIGMERLINSHKMRAGLEKNPFKFMERTAGAAVIYDENEHGLTAPTEFVPDEESLLSVAVGPFVSNRYIPVFQKELAAISIYHDFHTNRDAKIRQSAVARVERRVDPDGQNLISVLHTLYTGDRDFKCGIDLAMRAAFGDDFEELVFPPAADQRVQLQLRWRSLSREQSAESLSDGTLRFLFLLTVLSSPSAAPIIAIDEPETGLHPSMLPIIAEYAVEASKRSQIILTTHSPQLLDAFPSEAVPTTTVARWENGETLLTRCQEAELAGWLKEYSLGALYRSGELEEMLVLAKENA